MRKCPTKVTNKSTLKMQSQLTAEAATVTTPTVNLRREKTPPPESIIKRSWPQLDPKSSDPTKITGPPKVVSLAYPQQAHLNQRERPRFYSIFISRWSIFRSNTYDNTYGKTQLVFAWEQEKLQCKKMRWWVLTTFHESFFCVRCTLIKRTLQQERYCLCYEELWNITDRV